jgi:hypothetical protein
MKSKESKSVLSFSHKHRICPVRFFLSSILYCQSNVRYKIGYHMTSLMNADSRIKNKERNEQDTIDNIRKSCIILLAMLVAIDRFNIFVLLNG